VTEERRAPALPPSEEQAIQAALESNQELRKLQSQIVSKGLELRGAGAARWPKMDLVAQYGMLAKFNNYADFFQKFPTQQRTTGRLISIAGAERLGPGRADGAGAARDFPPENRVGEFA